MLLNSTIMVSNEKNSINQSSTFDEFHFYFEDGHRCRPEARPGDKIILFGIALPIACCFGALANLVKFMVLCDRKHLHSPHYIYMTALAASHCITLAFEGIIMFGLHFLNDFTLFEFLFPNLIWPVFNYFLTLSLTIFVALTVQTYVHVRCFSQPTLAEVEKRQAKARFVVAALFVAAFIFNAPRTLAFAFNWSTYCFEQRWPSDINSWFSIYNYARIIFYNIGCLILLTIFQLLLVAFLCKNGNATHHSRKMDEMRKLTVGLAVSAVFCVILEITIVLTNPITLAVLWQNVVPKTSSLDNQLNSATRLAYALVAVEYWMIYVFSLTFNSKLRRRLVYKLSSTSFLFRSQPGLSLQHQAVNLTDNNQPQSPTNVNALSGQKVGDFLQTSDMLRISVDNNNNINSSCRRQSLVVN